MRFLEIDPSIIDPNSLNEKIQARAATVKADGFFDSDPVGEKQIINSIGVKELHAQMLKVYDNLHKMDVFWELKPLEITSHRPIIGKLVVFAKKAFRKMTRWLFQPYWDRITAFHSAATLTIFEMIRLQEMLISVEEKRGNQ